MVDADPAISHSRSARRRDRGLAAAPKEKGAHLERPKIESKAMVPDSIPNNSFFSLPTVEHVADVVTMLRSLGPSMAKTWRTAETVESYDDALWFTVDERSVSSLLDLAAVLNEVQRDPRVCLIRGRLREDWREVLAVRLPEWTAERVRDGKAPLVQPHPDAVLRRKALFDDEPHHWLMLDIEGFRPQVDPVASPARAIDEFVTLLPAEMQGCSYWWQLSGSAGLPKYRGELRTHLFMWTESAHTSVQLTAWARGVNESRKFVDESVFRTVQAHFVAAPVFASGVADPVPLRSGFADYSWLGGDAVDLRLTSEALTAADCSAKASDLVDPRTKQGLIGAFHRAFSVEQIVERWLGDHFEFVTQNRLTWLGGGGAAEGAYARADRQGLGAMHSTWPWGAGSAVNSWDLVRHFVFGHLDAADDALEAAVLADRAPHELPSHSAMFAMAKGLPEVQAQLPGDDADKVLDAAAVIEQIRAMPPSEVPARWAELALGLSKSGAQLVVDEVSRLTGLGKRPLAGDLADARKRSTVKAVEAMAHVHAAGRLVISNEVDAFTKSAALAEAEIVRRSTPGDFISFGGALARVATRPLPYSHRIDDEEAEPPPVWQIEPLDQAAILGAVEGACMFTETTAMGPLAIAVPQRVLDILRAGKDHVAPAVSGLVTHPVVLPDGSILASDGLDARTGLFMVNARLEGCRPYAQPEAVEAVQRVRGHLCTGFEFASPLDADLALAGLFTAVQRRVLDQAPGLCVVASVQASGKTTLPRRIHLFLTGQDLPVQTLAGDETEVQKRVLATLQRSPSMIVLDNIGDGLTFRSPTLAAIMTSPVWSSRVLGATHEVDVPTNATICVTGNNLQLGADELTRFMVCRLSPAAARPEERQFEHADVVQHALRVRAEVLRDVLGIVAGCVQAGGVEASRGVRFKRWDRLVRGPLIWAGALDPAAAFAANSATSEEHLALGGLLGTLRGVFGADEFGSGDVAALVRGDAGFSSRAAVKAAAVREGADRIEELAGRLRSQLEALRTKDVSGERSVGHAMAARVGRVVSLEIEGVTQSARLMSRPDKNLGVKLYSVEVLA